MRSLIAARQKQVDQERASQDMTDYAEFAKLFEPGGECKKRTKNSLRFLRLIVCVTAAQTTRRHGSK
eukprot:COSAG01_NODE_35135_length_536_cov_1.656751_1_plen_66_part_01